MKSGAWESGKRLNGNWSCPGKTFLQINLLTKFSELIRAKNDWMETIIKNKILSKCNYFFRPLFQQNYLRWHTYSCYFSSIRINIVVEKCGFQFRRRTTKREYRMGVLSEIAICYFVILLFCVRSERWTHKRHFQSFSQVISNHLFSRLLGRPMRFA